MHEASKARPVSGEIMTEPLTAPNPFTSAARSPAAAIIDAEFETIAPGIRGPAPIDSVENTIPLAGMDVLRRDEAARPLRRQPGGVAFWLFGLSLVGVAFWISGGHALLPRFHLPNFIRAAPTLKIASVKSVVENIEGHAILFVDGKAANETGRAIDVPPLGISVEDRNGKITRYFLGTRDRHVAAGETFAFSSRLEVPKNGVKSVSVSFDQKE